MNKDRSSVTSNPTETLPARTNKYTHQFQVAADAFDKKKIIAERVKKCCTEAVNVKRATFLTSPYSRSFELKGFPFLSQSMDGCGLPSAGHLNSTLAPDGSAKRSRSVMRRPQRGGPSASTTNIRLASNVQGARQVVLQITGGSTHFGLLLTWSSTTGDARKVTRRPHNIERQRNLSVFCFSHYEFSEKRT